MEINCPSCNEAVLLADEDLVKAFECPFCQQRFQIDKPESLSSGVEIVNPSSLKLEKKEAQAKMGKSNIKKYIIIPVLLIFAFMLSYFLLGYIGEFLSVSFSLIGGIAVSIIGVLLVLTFILWIFFPLFMYQYIVRLDKSANNVEQLLITINRKLK